MPKSMWHPFKVGMGSDQALKIAKKRSAFRHRVAKNQIQQIEPGGNLVMEWYFAACTLVIAWDPDFPGFTIREIQPPLVTGNRLSTAQAGMKSEEVRDRVEALKMMEKLGDE